MIPDMSTQTPLTIGILGSGRGTNAQAITDAIAAGRLNARVVCVISDVEDALILERARNQGIPAEYISGAPFKTKLEGEAERRYIETLRRYGARAVALAGFMRIVKRGMLDAFPYRILNIHPALHSHGPDLPVMLAQADAALIIGDNALVQDGGEMALPAPADHELVYVEKIDLGSVWTEATGLPFVWAVWAGRAGCLGGFGCCPTCRLGALGAGIRMGGFCAPASAAVKAVLGGAV